jgi:hypothetical protein
MAPGFDPLALQQTLTQQIQSIQQSIQDAVNQAVAANAVVTQSLVSGGPLPPLGSLETGDMAMIQKILANPELKKSVMALVSAYNPAPAAANAAASPPSPRQSPG